MTNKLILSIDEHASLIEFKIGANRFIPYEAGIYLPGGDTPVLRHETNNYYGLKKEKGRVISQYPILSIEDIVDTVYDADFEVVIPGILARNAGKFLSYSPTVPVRGRAIVEAYIADSVYFGERKNKIPKDLNVRSAWETITHTELITFEEFQDILIDTLSEIKIRVIEFTGVRSWNMHSVFIREGNLHINVEGDYRIMEWERLTKYHETQSDLPVNVRGA